MEEKGRRRGRAETLSGVVIFWVSRKVFFEAKLRLMFIFSLFIYYIFRLIVTRIFENKFQHFFVVALLSTAKTMIAEQKPFRVYFLKLLLSPVTR